MGRHYTDFAARRGIPLLETGPCQLCGALVERGRAWTYDTSRMLSEVLDAQKNTLHAPLPSPIPCARGRITMHDVRSVQDEDAREACVVEWARCVFDARAEALEEVHFIANLFEERHPFTPGT